jgi:hypothetical protein
MRNRIIKEDLSPAPGTRDPNGIGDEESGLNDN